MVYRLRQVKPTGQGRVALIRYRKATDLSGMSLGGLQSAGTRPGGSTNAAQVGGLIIRLQGEIEFDIDRGVVLRTTHTQQGSWNLNMNAPSLGGSKEGGLTQDMKIRIPTQFQWSSGSQAPLPTKPQETVPQSRPLPFPRTDPETHVPLSSP